MTQKNRQRIGHHLPHGVDLLHDPHLNKGTAFTEAEREKLKIRGLLPARITSESEQKMRVMENYNRKDNDLERYIYLASLHDRNETLFYQVLIDHIAEMMPIVYTPVVGEACQKYGHIFRRARGLFLSAEDRGRVTDVLRNWPDKEVGVIVVTDGERILGLGDQGANGMGIPVGKLTLYTTCAGVHPRLCLPVTIDVGTDNEGLLRDPLYIGLPRHRLRGEPYDELLDEFITAANECFPGVLIQFEDFATANAFRLLRKYRNQICCFNDDIQGTASVTLAGLYSGLRITGNKFEDQRILFLGAGEAATGTADLIVSAMLEAGLAEPEALRRCWFVDSHGLVVRGREGLAEHKVRYAHEHAQIDGLHDAVRTLRPTVLAGFSGQGQAFTRSVIEAMTELNERPMIFALSNPSSKSECTAEQAYAWSKGKAVFASGSPFDPVEYEGQTFVPGQGNNSYIFPGIGLGVLATGARRVIDEMFSAAARTLAAQVSSEDLRQGCIYPPLAHIRDVSAEIAAAVANIAFDQNLATRARPDEVLAWIKSSMYEPNYQSYV